MNNESNIAFVRAKSISNIYDKDNPHFWNHHGYNHDDYLKLADSSRVLYEKWQKGVSINELLKDERFRDMVYIFLVKPNVIKVTRVNNDTYALINDGRHRVVAAQELDIFVPVIIRNT